MDQFSLPNLLCEEDESCLSESKVFKFDWAPVSKAEDYEYIQSLIKKESNSNCYGCTSDDDRKSKNWFKCARLDAINWIFNTREAFGFHIHTAYLSLTYFDRFCSRRFINNEKECAIPLLSIACLSLAAKMEEQIVPSLSQYQAQGYNFECSVIRRMELMVLTTLEWKMCSISPFTYLQHFFSKIRGGCDSSSEFSFSKAIGLILDLAREISLMDHRPSVIAAAAVLAVSGDQLTRKMLEFKISVVSSVHSLEKESIYSCYNILKEIETRKNRTPKSMIPSCLFTSSLNRSSTISTMITKRKLTYSEFEQHCPLQKINRNL